LALAWEGSDPGFSGEARVKACVLIKIRTGEIPDALSHLREATGVLSADMTLGPYDAIAVVAAYAQHRRRADLRANEPTTPEHPMGDCRGHLDPHLEQVFAPEQRCPRWALRSQARSLHV
jgi:hypothetical protein